MTFQHDVDIACNDHNFSGFKFWVEARQNASRMYFGVVNIECSPNAKFDPPLEYTLSQAWMERIEAEFDAVDFMRLLTINRRDAYDFVSKLKWSMVERDQSD